MFIQEPGAFPHVSASVC